MTTVSDGPRATTTGPPPGQPSPNGPPAHEELGFFGRIWRDSRNWGELRRTPYGFRPVLILGSITFFGLFNGFAFRFAAPDIARDLDITISGIITVTIIVGFFTIFAAIGAGWWADRKPRLPFVGIGTMLNGVFAMTTAGVARSAVSLGTPVVAAEVADAGGSVPRFSLLADYYPPESRGKVFAVLGTIRQVARLIAPLTVGILIVEFGWRSIFFVTGIPLVIMGIITLLRLREPPRGYFERKAMGVEDDVARVEDEPQSFGEAWRTVWAVRTLRRLFMGDIWANFGEAIYAFFLVFFLAENYGLNAFERAVVFTPATVFALFGGFIGGGLVDTFTRRKPGRVLTTVGIFSLISSLAIAGLVFEPPLIVVVALACVQAFGGSLLGPSLGAVYSQVIPPSVRTQGLQMLNLAQVPAFMFAISLGGLILGAHGYPPVFLFAFPFVVLGAIIYSSAGSFFDVDRRNAFAAAVAAEEWRRSRESGQGKLLVCRNVDVEYDGVQVLFGVDFDVDQGQIIALLGTNGAGKSTLLRAISGSQEASGGAIVFDGRDVTHMPPHEIARRGIIHMPGGRGVFPGLTVRENLMLGNWMTEEESEVRERLQEIFQMFPILRERAGEQAQSLSGGEQQMLSLAQAFLSRPRLLMIDELSLGLSPAVVAELLEVVREIHRRGVTIIVVEQSVNVALTIAEKAIFMEKGEVRFFGRTADLLARPDILRAVYVKGTGALTDRGPTGGVRTDREQRALDLQTSRAVLEVENVVKRYGGITAVDHVSLALREGEVLGVIGPNGSGKTTLFEIISGFQVADEGIVRYEGVDITNLSAEERARRKLIRRFQDARLFPSLTLFETLLIALEQRLEVKSALMNAAALPQARRAERRVRLRAERLVELLELGAYRDKFVKELSTGLRRIVDLACVLATEPKVLLLDEPSSGIAQAEAESLGPLLGRVRFETGCSILIIEHDMPLISAVADELIALDRGQVVTRGIPDDVLNDERVIESYLGGTEESIRRSGALA